MTLDTMQLGRLFRLANGGTLVLEPDTPYWLLAPGNDLPSTATRAKVRADAPRGRKPKRKAKGTRQAKASGAKAVRRTRRAAPTPAPAADAPPAAPPPTAKQPLVKSWEREDLVRWFLEDMTRRPKDAEALFEKCSYFQAWNAKESAKKRRGGDTGDE